MTDTSKPVFRDLPREQCEALLARHRVGRLAYSFHDRVDIEPIHYVYAEDWLFGRTSPGSKITTIGHNRWVAFEVDEVKGLFDWKSVVVRGSVYVLENEGAHRDMYERALYHLRALLPQTFEGDDPVPFRSVIFGIHVDSMTGREAKHE